MADDGEGRTAGAGARTIRSPDDAEQVAAEWMRHLGFGDARCTPTGTDGGVDVRSREAVAQVKAQLTPVGRPELQALYGVARSEGRQPMFFSLMSYTAAARGWADEVGMALFRFDHSGMVEAVNHEADPSNPTICSEGSDCTGDGISNRASCYESRCDIPGRNCT